MDSDYGKVLGQTLLASQPDQPVICIDQTQVEHGDYLDIDITYMLKDAGFDVVGQARDGEKAIELAHALQPDLVLMASPEDFR